MRIALGLLIGIQLFYSRILHLMSWYCQGVIVCRLGVRVLMLRAE